MDKNKIIELEKYIFRTIKNPNVAAAVVADIIGVLIDLKPAMMGVFNDDDLKDLKIEEFEKLLDELRLKRVFYENCYYGSKRMITYRHFCISKKLRLAKQTQRAFVGLWSTMDKGEILNRRKWVKFTKKIGRLLGYPKTAVIDFVKNSYVDNSDRAERMKRNRYYAHSAKYEDAEFRSYDQKLNRVISELAPKTAEVLTKRSEKRWLV